MCLSACGMCFVGWANGIPCSSREIALVQTQTTSYQSRHGCKDLYTEKETGREKRDEKRKRERKKETWYTKKEENPLNASPIFCPPTPKSTLASSWKQIAEEIKEQSNGLVSPKIVEQGGVPFKNLVTRTSPMETDKCDKTGLSCVHK